MKLQRKGISQDDVAETIEWLVEKNLLNDEEFARKKAESIFRIKLCGPKYIENKLREARVCSEIIEDVIAQIASQEAWRERAKKAIVQWKRIHPRHAEDRVRKMRFLASRGFDRMDGE